ncbi:hypothetical protein EGW08_000851 [Elysia chlorotica]|uniref:Uncharacterized protein n=1 Tax=Elysia chlorotica TaxID=188477 RepID=A0A433UC39_ELYCH|nr:hypothetical protein EGW08_000851 [Elysia chlorotica]
MRSDARKEFSWGDQGPVKALINGSKLARELGGHYCILLYSIVTVPACSTLAVCLKAQARVSEWARCGVDINLPVLWVSSTESGFKPVMYDSRRPQVKCRDLAQVGRYQSRLLCRLSVAGVSLSQSQGRETESARAATNDLCYAASLHASPVEQMKQFGGGLEWPCHDFRRGRAESGGGAGQSRHRQAHWAGLDSPCESGSYGTERETDGVLGRLHVQGFCTSVLSESSVLHFEAELADKFYIN